MVNMLIIINKTSSKCLLVKMAHLHIMIMIILNLMKITVEQK